VATISDNAAGAAAYLRRRIGHEAPGIAVVLGSGLARLAEESDGVRIPYADIPFFPRSTVVTHKGELIAEKDVLLLSGRVHYYEGYDAAAVAFYVRVLDALGVRTLVLTNAAGCIEQSWHIGDFMLISDHIKFTADSPARGEVYEGVRFFDMTRAYSPRLRALARECAGVLAETGGEKDDTDAADNIDTAELADTIGADGRTSPLPVPAVHEGVYAYMAGPQYETPAEIRALRVLGAQAVGMSTVYEAIAAAQCGMEVLGISCLTNMAAGMQDLLSDDHVQIAAGAVSEGFCRWVRAILKEIKTEA